MASRSAAAVSMLSAALVLSCSSDPIMMVDTDAAVPGPRSDSGMVAPRDDAGTAAHDDAGTTTGWDAGFVEDCEAIDHDESTSFVPDALRSLAVEARTTTVSGVTVDYVEYPLPHPDGNPWSIWGKGTIASNGRFYSAMGDHRSAGASALTDGNAYLFEYDPGTRTLRPVGDVISAYGMHVTGENGYGKIHGQVDEGPCGLLYMHTYWGSERAVVYGGSYEGDLLLRYNPWTKHLESLGVQMMHRGTPSTNMWRAGGLFYGEANAPSTGMVQFWAYDVVHGERIFVGADMARENRNIAVDAQGRAYYTGGGAVLYRFDPATRTEERLPVTFESSWLRASTDVAPDGTITMVTDGHSDAPPSIYRFDPEAMTLDRIGSATDYVADIEADPTGRFAYFVPGAHGSSDSFPLVELDRTTGETRTLLSLGAALASAGAVQPRGTYSIDISPDASTLYIAANAGPLGTTETFGQPILLVVHLEAAP